MFPFSLFKGVGGNLVAVQASRISTSLHRISVLGVLPAGIRYGCIHSFCTAGRQINLAYIQTRGTYDGLIIIVQVVIIYLPDHFHHGLIN